MNVDELIAKYSFNGPLIYEINDKVLVPGKKEKFIDEVIDEQHIKSMDPKDVVELAKLGNFKISAGYFGRQFALRANGLILPTDKSILGYDNLSFKVLNIDVDAITNDYLRLMLKKHNIKMDLVDNFDSAIESVNKEPYLAVFMELYFKGGSGIELTKKIREFSDVPIIMKTTYGSKFKDQFKNAGGNDYFVIPDQNALVTERLKSLIPLYKN